MGLAWKTWIFQVLKTYRVNYQRTSELSRIRFDDLGLPLNQLQWKQEGLVSATARDRFCWGLDSILLALEIMNGIGQHLTCHSKLAISLVFKTKKQKQNLYQHLLLTGEYHIEMALH